ncbi:autotransporter outer membrane beta-barrel domain-containing protein [Pandoraea fibrosis]|uniref:Autotransporter outer membrane beta-barrel domain-containing protein n=1 Tax=Pandoraea fibrosis TaxID=1891094 RepID=A0ABX6HND0_9BURK|nr:autotransporter outer membrane beta-barrel domain-containing protein [Pandoraea fibrosis]QHE91183.1 autotransporter outer membrane beta-barrel domain-containing protein [Pandoraea fibrosis]QHF12014.1 autotransporter outer membrane beta-barrel domain-containing protein [Pandoraea fibrosis]
MRESTGVDPVVQVSGTGITYSGTSVSLTATGTGLGVQATNKGTVTLDGTTQDVSTVETLGAGGHGLYANGGGQITGTNTTITTSGAGASAAFADAGGLITLNNVNTYSFGDNAPGAVASGAGSRLSLIGTYVNVYGNGSAGLFATAGGNITINGGAIASGDYYGGTVNANSPGMLARGPGSSIVVSNGASSATYGANSPGVWADAGGKIDFAGYGIFTYQPDSPGAQATGASTITLTSTIVRTSGPSSAGLLVSDGSTVLAKGTEITTGYRVSGSSPPVLQFPDAQIGLEAHGVDVVGAGSQLQAENNAVTTNGDGAVGIWAQQGGTASVTGGTITTHGADTASVGGADAVRATDSGSLISLTGTRISTTNAKAVGVHASAGGTIGATDITVNTQGQSAFGALAQDAGSAVTLNRAAITTAGVAANGIEASNSGQVQASGGSVTTAGSAAHGIAAINGGTVSATGTAIEVSGNGSAAIYLSGSAPSIVSVNGGSLSAANGAIVMADGGTGAVTLSGVNTIAPATVNGRKLLAQATEDAAGTASNLTLNIVDMPTVSGDIVVDPSTLTYHLGNSRWVGDLVLSGAGNTVNASFDASQWTGDLLADAGNTANVSLQGSLWTGLARNATNVAIDGSSVWNVTGNSNVVGAVSNAGLIQFLALPGSYSALTVGSYAGGAGGRIGFNTYLGTDNSPTNLLVVNGGQASGTTALLVNNAGGPGAQTTADGIRLVQVTGGGTSATNAFALGQRVAAGAYEYQLFRGGSTGADDWFLRSNLSVAPSSPSAPTTEIPLYRPEVALYMPVPALARQMGLATLGTLHQRVGEEENLRGIPEGRTYGNLGWARVFGAHVNNRWTGDVDTKATGNQTGVQAGFDLLRRTTDSGHRDHVGVYAAYTDYNTSSVSGFALGTQDLEVGKLSMSGPSVGAYWTHFGPSGWYTDAVFQTSWYDINAKSNYGAEISPHATGYTASLETGYPIRFGDESDWQWEPQAQIIWQHLSVNHAQDAYSSVDWDSANAVTGRLGIRLQRTGRDARGTLWQPYALLNLWHAFSGSDQATFGTNAPIASRFGETAVEIGGGVTARVNAYTSFYGQASYRVSLDDSRSRQSVAQGIVGVRFNW